MNDYENYKVYVPIINTNITKANVKENVEIFLELSNKPQLMEFFV